MSIKLNYYELLEVNEVASQKEIKNAYRKQAKKYHPDKNPNCKYSEQKFKFINEAYETLSCEIKRNKYDRERRRGLSESFDDSIDLGEEFDIKREKSQYVDVLLTIEESYYGTEKEVEYIKHTQCEDCNGTGAENGKTRTCPVCNGKGVAVNKSGFIGIRSQCPNCEGKGYFFISECKKCKGEGKEGKREKRKVKIPRGISDKDLVKLKIDEDTEIYMKFEVSGEIGFIRHESDLYYKLDITLDDILLGSKHKLKYLKEEVEFEVPEYSRHKDVILIKGAGFPMLNTKKKGDVVVELNLIYPKIDKNLREMLSKLRK